MEDVMLQRFLTFVLFGVLSLAAIEGFEARSDKREVKQGSPAVTTDSPSGAQTMDDGNPLPPQPF
jgi:hypothetical protein